VGVIYVVRHGQAAFGTEHYDRLTGIVEGHSELGARPLQETFPALDEYNPEAVMMAFTGNFPAPAPAAVRRDPVVVREHFRVLRDALLAWAEDRTQPEGMPVWRAFQDGAVAALAAARLRFPGGNVLIISSGGPIAAIVAAALNAPPATAVELNLRIRNSSLTEFASTPRRHHLVSFNGLPHLDTNPDTTLITYA